MHLPCICSEVESGPPNCDFQWGLRAAITPCGFRRRWVVWILQIGCLADELGETAPSRGNGELPAP